MKRKFIVGAALACLLALAGPALASSNSDYGTTQKYLHSTDVGSGGRHFR